jgi:hypothetical protein
MKANGLLSPLPTGHRTNKPDLSVAEVDLAGAPKGEWRVEGGGDRVRGETVELRPSPGSSSRNVVRLSEYRRLLLRH